MKNITKSITFVGILMILLFGVSHIFKYYNYGITTVDNEPPNSLDYLSIGDSESYTSISPMQLFKDYGYVGYNLGSAGQKIQETYFDLKSALNTQQPKLVLFETNTLFQPDALNTRYVNIVQSMVKKDFSIFNNHNSWKDILIHRFKNNNLSPIELSSKDPLKGFKYRSNVKAYTGGNYTSATDKVEPVDQFQMHYMEEIIQLCKEKDIQLILFNAPSPKNWTYAKHNATQEIANKNNLQYIDFNLLLNEINIDWSKDTYDSGDHLNFNGAIKTTSYMGEYIHTHSLLPSRKGNSNYHYWEQSLKNYRIQTNGGNHNESN